MNSRSHVTVSNFNLTALSLTFHYVRKNIHHQFCISFITVHRTAAMSVVVAIAGHQHYVGNAQCAIFPHQLRLAWHRGSGSRRLDSVVGDYLAVGRTRLQERIGRVRVLQVAPHSRQLCRNLKVFVCLSANYDKWSK